MLDSILLVAPTADRTLTFCTRPPWLRYATRPSEAGLAEVAPPSGSRFTEIKERLRERDLHTVCEEANCPNMGECWSGGTAPAPRRSCSWVTAARAGVTSVTWRRRDEVARLGRAENVADAVAEIGLDYVVLTSVDRDDDLADGGSEHFAETIREIQRRDPEILVETLIPDFQGDPRRRSTGSSTRGRT